MLSLTKKSLKNCKMCTNSVPEFPIVPCFLGSVYIYRIYVYMQMYSWCHSCIYTRNAGNVENIGNKSRIS